MSDLIIAIDARLAAGESTGDSSYWSGLLYGLSQIKHVARFLLFSNAEPPSAIPCCDNFEWIELPARNSRWWSLVAFPLAARKRGASVLHTQYNLSPLAGRIGITTIHDVSFFIGPEWFRPRDLFLLRRFVPASAKRARRVITVSETSRGEIEKFIPSARGKVAVTPLACPIHINPASTVDARAKFGLDGPFLLTVGTRWPRKNMSLAIEAAKLSGYRIVVTGKPGWGEGDFPSHAVATGYVDAETLSALYREASLYLAPSRHEGFGLPVLEAFACGCPVMCSSGGSLPEVAGDAAVVVDSWNSADWAARIREIMADSSKLDDLRRRGSARGAEFSWEATARKTMEIYQQVATERKP
ncbi:MAG TPA: glycosyltransferase family 1 protein [Fimbriimonadaceae bacterium]|nr:glycosyltransferase family 1 protein [Fimbriimonadaceae bacterium]